MVFSYSDTLNRDKLYVKGKHWVKKIGDKYLITTEYGPWVFLNEEEYDLFRLNKIQEDPNLFSTLEDRGVILTETNMDRTVDMYRKKFNYLFNGISLHILVPTLRCNMKCIYCAQLSRPLNAKEFDLDEETAREIIDFAFQSPSRFIVFEFQGGEPLVNFPIVKYMIEYAKKKNNSDQVDNTWWMGKKEVSFRIVSNFISMDEDILDYLIENQVGINSSLDGPKELHNKNRTFPSGGGTYDQVVKWIDIIRKQKKYPYFGLLPTISRYSLDYPKEIVDEYLKHDVRQIWMRQLNIAGTAMKEWKNVGYTAEEFLDFWKEFLEYVIKLNKEGVHVVDTGSRAYLKKILKIESEGNACLNSPCGAGLIQCAYTQDGDIYTCDEARSNELFKLGNVKHDNYKEIFTSKQVQDMIGLSSGVTLACNNCPWHPFCSLCLVSTYGNQKNLIPKLPIDFLCKIRKGQLETLFKKLLSDERKILLNWAK